MIKLKAIENFTLGLGNNPKYKFEDLKNIVRATDMDIDGALFINDTFECDEKMADYLTNKELNPVNRSVVEVIEIIPEEEIQKAIDEAVEEEKPKTTKKRTTKKK